MRFSEVGSAGTQASAGRFTFQRAYAGRFDCWVHRGPTGFESERRVNEPLPPKFGAGATNDRIVSISEV